MGAAIDAQTEPDRHRDLSRKLSEFAAAVQEIVTAHEGVLVYSGGDDVLAYLPVHKALACADALQAAFRQQMASFHTADGAQPTLSAGLVVAHYLDSLADALELARSAERQAKDKGGRDALAVTLSKRSGADRTVVGKWQTLTPRLEKMIGFMRHGAISKGAAYELQELYRVLGGPGGLPHKALAGEARRIVERKRESGGDKKADHEAVRCIQHWLTADMPESGELDPDLIVIEPVVLDELAQELILAEFFARAYDMAYGEIGKEEVTA
jgi:CRISPR-associated protein Cmr2